jgi:hypothetical protein
MRKLIKSALFAVLVAGAGAAGGCAGTYRGTYTASAGVTYPSAGFVEVDNGVYAVYDSPEPVYYVNDGYWSVRGGVWYHRVHWDRPWVRVSVNTVPRRIVVRDHRTVVHVRDRRVVRHPGRVVVRDHRRRR